MNFTFELEELELLLKSLRASIVTLTIFNKNTEALEKLAEDFAIEKGKVTREWITSEPINHRHTTK